MVEVKGAYIYIKGINKKTGSKVCKTTSLLANCLVSQPATHNWLYSSACHSHRLKNKQTRRVKKKKTNHKKQINAEYLDPYITHEDQKLTLRSSSKSLNSTTSLCLKRITASFGDKPENKHTHTHSFTEYFFSRVQRVMSVTEWEICVYQLQCYIMLAQFLHPGSFQS